METLPMEMANVLEFRHPRHAAFAGYLRPSWQPLVICLAFLPRLAVGAGDVITILEKTGVATANYPVQIGRPFVQGEIATCPQAVIRRTPIVTQANVMTRWPDGSAKHAIVSFLIPSIGANGAVTVTFQNQVSCNTTPLTTAQMMDSAYDFNAQMQLTNGGITVTADARTMLNAGAYTVWAGGSVAQTV